MQSISWVISPEERTHFERVFSQTEKGGYVTGEQAKELFSKSGLQIPDLAKIWSLSDVDKDAKLNKEEFLVAMVLIIRKKNNPSVPIPDVLPPTLLPATTASSSVTAAATTSNTSSPVIPPASTPIPALAPPLERKASTSTITPQRRSSANLLAQSPVLESASSVQNSSTSSYPAITAQDVQKYKDIFVKANGNGELFMTDQTARNLFTRSGLEMPVLAKIWSLSDADKDSKLSEHEFMVAMHLINCKKRGVEVPDSLPESLSVGNLSITSSLPASNNPPPLRTMSQSNLQAGALVISPLAGNNASLMQLQPTSSSLSYLAQPSQNFDVDRKKIENDIHIGNQRKEQLTSQILSGQANNSELEQVLSQQKAEYDSLLKQVERLEVQNKEVLKKQGQLQDQINLVNSQISSLKEEKEKVQFSFEQKNREYQEQEESLRHSNQQLEEEKKNLEKQTQQLQTLSREIESIKQKKVDNQSKLSNLQSQSAQVKQQYSDLESKKDSSSLSSPTPQSPAPSPFFPSNGIDSFGNQPFDFNSQSSFDFGSKSDFGSQSEFGSQNNKPRSTSNNTPFSSEQDPFSSDSFGNASLADTGATSFGDSFGPSDSFSPQPTKTVKQPDNRNTVRDEDPFSFSSELKENDSSLVKDSFGESTPFGDSSSFSKEPFNFNSFNNNDLFSPSAAPKQSANSGAPSFSSFDDFGFAPSSNTEFDSGKDTFG
eukprot:TRINITY_DN15194_c0_g1_i1.p1 TRINITY_DN15194_c0_g1~~TRINITY_DN15194_c0_g1_i1.p1  ORF type:complete len:714 (-),score=315.08 TRINITY_DN15194_c0_g1_i1:82-2223(-)